VYLTLEKRYFFSKMYENLDSLSRAAQGNLGVYGICFSLNEEKPYISLINKDFLYLIFTDHGVSSFTIIFLII
jgi:hypothetical protein